jgi:predicted transcriptional regulator of viral defense system
MSDLDLKISELASRQHGVFSIAQVRELTKSRTAVRHRLAQGRWVALHLGVFRLAGVPQSWRQKVLAAVLCCPESAASHSSAAMLHGVPGYRAGAVAITTQRGGRRRVEGVEVHGSLLLPDRHVTTVDAIPTTSVARTLFDLAGSVHPLRAERALDHALARNLVQVPACWDVFLELAERGRSGTVLMRRLLMERGEGYVAPERVGVTIHRVCEAARPPDAGATTRSRQLRVVDLAVSISYIHFGS